MPVAMGSFCAMRDASALRGRVPPDAMRKRERGQRSRRLRDVADTIAGECTAAARSRPCAASTLAPRPDRRAARAGCSFSAPSTSTAPSCRTAPSTGPAWCSPTRGIPLAPEHLESSVAVHRASLPRLSARTRRRAAARWRRPRSSPSRSSPTPTSAPIAAPAAVLARLRSRLPRPATRLIPLARVSARVPGLRPGRLVVRRQACALDFARVAGRRSVVAPHRPPLYPCFTRLSFVRFLCRSAPRSPAQRNRRPIRSPRCAASSTSSPPVRRAPRRARSPADRARRPRTPRCARRPRSTAPDAGSAAARAAAVAAAARRPDRRRHADLELLQPGDRR